MCNTLILSYPASKALKKWFNKMCLNPKDAILFSSLFLHLLLCVPTLHSATTVLQFQSSNYDLTHSHPFFTKFFSLSLILRLAHAPIVKVKQE